MKPVFSGRDFGDVTVIKCIFLGYAFVWKGRHLWYREEGNTLKSVIRRDVTFESDMYIHRGGGTCVAGNDQDAS